ncbi:hypothetical protein LENED_001521 [Lentinula edodes]|uniref:Uncharacterized protein n=1 Tax=Lentinula edodes TaxID=5353 RepID=A0A1Q3DYL7_LENED|nr:hypothetical protein LENED_001521 [Lentinula edodes]
MVLHLSAIRPAQELYRPQIIKHQCALKWLCLPCTSNWPLSGSGTEFFEAFYFVFITPTRWSVAPSTVLAPKIHCLPHKIQHSSFKHARFLLLLSVAAPLTNPKVYLPFVSKRRTGRGSLIPGGARYRYEQEFWIMLPPIEQEHEEKHYLGTISWDSDERRISGDIRDADDNTKVLVEVKDGVLSGPKHLVSLLNKKDKSGP